MSVLDVMGRAIAAGIWTVITALYVAAPVVVTGAVLALALYLSGGLR